MRQNTITTLFANKGSGKTMLATALSLAQPKPIIFVSPILNSIPKHFRDKINESELKDDFYNGVSYIYYIDDVNELEELISSVLDLGNVCLCIDEIDFFYKNILDKDLELYKLVNYGRHKQIDLIVMARRLQDTPKVIVSQTDVFYIGRIGRSFTDFEYIRKTLDKEVAESAQYLDTGSFIRVELGKDRATLIKLPYELIFKLQRGMNEY